ncbi:hypothetical protein [Streptomyces flavofungini]|uniref:Membrane protein YndG n=1 Tax=Streptomyces flavofungini TaxID=68200 RepID=A0ABS0WZ56_9ACTN|nr:hypothetical protein [Streptomyces flavofungini]MBJ3806218.1 hypothetical protein [Streptomyces flavofungini]GHC46586.1 hypothetical protein GCM10010349_09480 [Streptomyces flavofungini]
MAHGSPPSLYVEALIRADLDELWERTQEPGLHQRWDLRFTEIDYLPGTPGAPGAPRRFRYATRVLPFLTIAGTGVSAGEKRRPDGTRTSALRFASPHPLSLLAEGSGYWRYVPTGDGVRFLTGYDYRPRWGRLGALADRAVLRPLMGWATAWSFDRLRLWLERGITPERGLVHGVGEVVARALCVAAAGVFAGPVAALVVAALVLVVPPLPTTPAARRCLRTPPERARAPRLLDALDVPTPPEGPATSTAPAHRTELPA